MVGIMSEPRNMNEAILEYEQKVAAIEVAVAGVSARRSTLEEEYASNQTDKVWSKLETARAQGIRLEHDLLIEKNRLENARRALADHDLSVKRVRLDTLQAQLSEDATLKFFKPRLAALVALDSELEAVMSVLERDLDAHLDRLTEATNLADDLRVPLDAAIIASGKDLLQIAKVNIWRAREGASRPDYSSWISYTPPTFPDLGHEMHEYYEQLSLRMNQE